MKKFLGLIYKDGRESVHSENFSVVIKQHAKIIGMKPIDYIDGRRRQFWRFKYCPETGEFIDWSEWKKVLIESVGGHYINTIKHKRKVLIESVGIETAGGKFHPMIEEGSKIPISKEEVFTTASDNQPAVSVIILLSEDKSHTKPKVLGKFDLMGIKPEPAGIPQIVVSFAIDEDGIFFITAKDLKTDIEKNLTISKSEFVS